MKAFSALIVLAVAFGFRSDGPGPELKPGAQAPAFALKNVDGKIVNLSDFRNQKGAVVIFTCNHCPFAIAYEDRIIALDKKYRPQGYPVIAINPNDPKKEPADSFEKMKERAEKKGFSFPYLFDSDQSIATAYGATRTPHVFVVNNENGKGIIRYVGTIDNNAKDASAATEHYLADALDALLRSATPTTNYTKAVGCTIKWADAK